MKLLATTDPEQGMAIYKLPAGLVFEQTVACVSIDKGRFDTRKKTREERVKHYVRKEDKPES